MGSFKKKILINKIKLIDKARMASGVIAQSRSFKTSEIHRAIKDERRSSYIAADELQKLVAIARAHALWLHMVMLKEAFRFTGKQLSEYREKLQDVYKYAFYDAGIKAPLESIVAVTVKGSPKDDEGSFGYTDYSQEPFDADGY